jgi:hypothetical protein
MKSVKIHVKVGESFTVGRKNALLRRGAKIDRPTFFSTGTMALCPYSETCSNLQHSKLPQKSSVSKFVCGTAKCFLSSKLCPFYSTLLIGSWELVALTSTRFGFSDSDRNYTCQFLWSLFDSCCFDRRGWVLLEVVISPCIKSLRPRNRVTRWVCEKVVQNVAQPNFCQH